MDSDKIGCAPHRPANQAQVVCPLYETMYRFLEARGFPILTSTQQRAWAYHIDLDSDFEHVHADKCQCIEYMPAIMQALEPDPVDHIVAERTLEDVENPTKRYDRQLISPFQGITFTAKTQKAHTHELQERANELLADFEVLFQAVLNRKKLLGMRSRRQVIEEAFPKLIDLQKGAKRRTFHIEADSINTVKRNLESRANQAMESLNRLQRTLQAWSTWGI